MSRDVPQGTSKLSHRNYNTTTSIFIFNGQQIKPKSEISFKDTREAIVVRGQGFFLHGQVHSSQFKAVCCNLERRTV